MKKKIPLTAATPHVLYRAINDRKPLASVLAEFADNSFSEDAGNASTVEITINDDSIVFWDNGRGIDDLNKLAAPGSTGSYVNDKSIGQYGWGSKTWLGIARKLVVETCFQGRVHHHIFDTNPIRRALRRGVNTKWLNEYSGQGVNAHGEPSFTKLTLCELVKGPPIILATLIADLSRTYWSGLQSGKSILISDCRRGKNTSEHIPLFAPPSLSEVLQFDSVVNDKRYRAKFGTLDIVGKNSGIFIAYGFRTIETISALPHRALPPKLHGQILLSEDWRKSMSTLKNSIVHDREELLEDIQKKISSLLDQIDEELRQINDKAFSQLVTKNANKARKRRTPNQQPESEPEAEPTSLTSDNVIPIPKPKPKPKILPPGEKPEAQYGYAIQWQHLGPGVMEMVSVNDEQLVITLNSDLEAVGALRSQPMWPATALHLGSSIVAHCDKLSIEEVKRYFGYMLGEEKESGSRDKYREQIRLWWASRSCELSSEDTLRESRIENLKKANAKKAALRKK